MKGWVREVPSAIKVVRDVLSANDEIAARNQQALAAYGILTVNIMASPGAGKTSVIMAHHRGAARPAAQSGVIEGDVASSVDADKVATAGRSRGPDQHRRRLPPGRAHGPGRAGRLPLDALDLLFIENVGNLICPVAFAGRGHAGRDCQRAGGRRQAAQVPGHLLRSVDARGPEQDGPAALPPLRPGRLPRSWCGA